MRLYYSIRLSPSHPYEAAVAVGALDVVQIRKRHDCRLFDLLTFIVESILESFSCVLRPNDSECHCCFMPDEKAGIRFNGICKWLDAAGKAKLAQRERRFMPY